MNGDPHTHRLEILPRLTRKEVSYSSLARPFTIKYGDTEVKLTSWFGRRPSKRRIERAAKSAVVIHDRGSMKAAKREDELRQIKLAFDLHDQRQWGSEQLRKQQVNSG